MSQLALTNFINISVAAISAGVGQYNTSNLAIFTDEIPANSFGSLGYSQYVDPTQVGIDFGTASKTYLMANAIFSQQPNILTGGGQLVIILMGAATQTAAFSGIAASGVFKYNFGGNATANINWNDTAAQIQTKLRAVAGLADVTVTGSIASQSLVIKMAGVYGAAPAVLTVSANTLQTGGSVSVTQTITNTTPGESLDAAITRTVGLVQYFGIVPTATCAELTSVDLLAAAAVIQPLNKIGFFVTYTEADIQPGGMVDQLRTGSFTQSRGLYYGDSSAFNALVMSASYASRGLSVNFSGANTTSTMNLKTLSGVQPDPSMTQTIFNEALTAGADVYVSNQGVPGVASFGANKYFDQVYNLQWFVGALQVAGFNFLAQSSTKIPQTESGMDGLKGAYRAICEQAVTSQYSAPGSWTSSTTFGNPADLIANIAQRGYYIFSLPVSLQTQTDRAARKAPLVQIALKEAGAIQQSSVIVNVNA